jgi:hypothetical protein
MPTPSHAYASANALTVALGLTQSTQPAPLSQPVMTTAWVMPVKQFLLLGTIAPGWRLVQPLAIQLEQDEDGCYVVSDKVFAVYGVGDTPLEAQQDYITSLIDYYELLAARAEENDPPSQSLFDHLRLYFNPSAS